MEQLGDTLLKHFDGIAAYADHPVRFGVVESLNTTIKAVLAAPVACATKPCCC
jgi:transposase